MAPSRTASVRCRPGARRATGRRGPATAPAGRPPRRRVDRPGRGRSGAGQARAGSRAGPGRGPDAAPRRPSSNQEPAGCRERISTRARPQSAATSTGRPRGTPPGAAGALAAQVDDADGVRRRSRRCRAAAAVDGQAGRVASTPAPARRRPGAVRRPRPASRGKHVDPAQPPAGSGRPGTRSRRPARPGFVAGCGARLAGRAARRGRRPGQLDVPSGSSAVPLVGAAGPLVGVDQP